MIPIGYGFVQKGILSQRGVILMYIIMRDRWATHKDYGLKLASHTVAHQERINPRV